MFKHLVIDLDKNKLVHVFNLSMGSRLRLCFGRSVTVNGCTVESHMGSRSIFVDLSQNEKVPEVPQDAIESVRFEWLLRTPNYPNGSGSVGQTNVHIGTLDNEQRIHVEGKDIKAVFDTLNLFNVGQKPENWVSESARVSVRETLPEFCCKYHQKKFYEEEF